MNFGGGKLQGIHRLPDRTGSPPRQTLCTAFLYI